MIDIKEFDDCNVLALDFETNGSFYDMELFSVAGIKDLKTLDLNTIISGAYERKDFKDFFNQNKYKKFVFHNAKFDLMVLKKLGVEITKIDFDDTLIMARMLDENRRNGLKDVRVSILGKPEREGWKEIDKSDMNQYLEYARLDAEDTLELYFKLKPEITNEKLETVYELERKVIFPVIDMEYYGVLIDQTLIDKQRHTLEKTINEIKIEINAIVGIEYNLNSTKQLQEMFYQVLKYPPRADWKTKTGISTAEKVLLVIADGKKKYPQAARCAELLLKHREYSKLLGSFIEGLSERLKDDGRIRPSFNALGAATGRFSCSNPNLQQIPRSAFDVIRDAQGKPILGDDGKTQPDLETHIRSLFIAGPGKVFVDCDFSQVELRMAAELSQDVRMIDAFKSGVDFHASTAALLNNKVIDDVTKDERSDAKAINFGVLYGMGPGKYTETTGISFNKACDNIKKYWEIYPRLKKFVDEVGDSAVRLGYVRTISGRKRRFISYDRNIRAQAFNTIDQGSCADLMKLAMILVFFLINRDKAKFVMQVHDEIILEADEDYADECKEIVQKCMEKALKTICPITAEPATGKRWSESK